MQSYARHITNTDLREDIFSRDQRNPVGSFGPSDFHRSQAFLKTSAKIETNSLYDSSDRFSFAYRLTATNTSSFEEHLLITSDKPS